jgi:hypothetical protein
MLGLMHHRCLTFFKGISGMESASGDSTPGEVCLRPSVWQLVNGELSGVPSLSFLLGLTHFLTFLYGTFVLV